MYVVQNKSGSIVVMPDLRARLRPGDIVDLHKVAREEDVKVSKDLRHCLKKGTLVVLQHTVVDPPKNAPKVRRTVTEVKLDSNELVQDLTQAVMTNIKQVLSDEMSKSRAEGQEHAAIAAQKQRELAQLTQELRDQINRVQIQAGSLPQSAEPAAADVPPDDVLATLQQKELDRLAKEMEAKVSTRPVQSVITEGRRKSLSELAAEL